MGRKVRLTLAALAGIAPLVLAAVPAAAAIPSGYQITVTESATTMAYNGQSPNFRASLTVPAGDPGPVSADTFSLLVDDQPYSGSVSGSAPTFSLFVATLSGAAPLSPGQHSVVARYASATNGLVTSAPITLTVQKASPALTCEVVNFAQTYLPGAPLTFSMALTNTNPPIDPRSSTFTITFAGAQTFTMSGLTADASGNVATTAPSTPDVYGITCTFDGNATVSPAGFRPGNLIVSLNHAIGGIRVHTDPSPVRDGVTITWNIVVLGTPGLPAPTGDVSVRLGSS